MASLHNSIALPKSEPECEICYEPLSTNWAITLHPCEHIFDLHCIAPWTVRCSTENIPLECPKCRTPITKLAGAAGSNTSAVLNMMSLGWHTTSVSGEIQVPPTMMLNLHYNLEDPNIALALANLDDPVASLVLSTLDDNNDLQTELWMSLTQLIDRTYAGDNDDARELQRLRTLWERLDLPAWAVDTLPREAVAGDGNYLDLLRNLRRLVAQPAGNDDEELRRLRGVYEATIQQGRVEGRVDDVD